jgi:hypothetical protein
MRETKCFVLLLSVYGIATLAGCSDGPASRDAGAGSDSGADNDSSVPGAARVAGTVTAQGGGPVAGARVTLATADLGYFEEARTDAAGAFAFADVSGGSYTVGASALRLSYEEAAVEVAGGDRRADLVLGAETHPGRWSVIGDTEPERPAGTPSATVLPDGRVMYCHDTEDAVIFDPVTGEKSFPETSPSSQGCHMQTVLPDGRVIFVGGQEDSDPASFTQAVRIVKTFDPVSGTWEELPDLNEERWYPTLVRLADGRLLACGGGQRPDASRTPTCELFDPDTGNWTLTGSLMQPTEYSPSALLLTGEVLTTWYPPQLYDPEAGTWRATGNFVQPNRGYPDHSDHSLVVLPDGRALIVGSEAEGAMVEIYDPAAGTWSAGSSPAVTRSMAEVVLLPDGRVLCAGGDLEQGEAPTNEFGRVALADLYDPEVDRWRSVAPMALAREYHAMTVLVPDGRVLTTSGTGNQASGPAPEASIEAFEPPYLFRGVRPRIESVSTKDLERGGTLTIRFSRTQRPTQVVLIGTSAVTHWMEGGVPRLLRLPFEVQEDSIIATLPQSAVELMPGHYILFLIVDDIPSEGIIVRALP